MSFLGKQKNEYYKSSLVCITSGMGIFIVAYICNAPAANREVLNFIENINLLEGILQIQTK